MPSTHQEEVLAHPIDRYQQLPVTRDVTFRRKKSKILILNSPKGYGAVPQAAHWLTVSFAWLAESTSLATLAVFALVNLALLRLRLHEVKSDAPHVTAPI